MHTTFTRIFGPLTAICVPGLFFAGCTSGPPPTVASTVDLARYAGTWYEIAKYPQIFESGLVGVTAEYTLRNDGTVGVTNRGFKGSFGGAVSSIAGTATVADATTHAKLKIRFDGFPMCLFQADYWILEVGESDPAQPYTYALVSDPARRTLWILSRTVSVEPATYDQILTRLSAQGFDTAKLESMPQPAP